MLKRLVFGVLLLTNYWGAVAAETMNTGNTDVTRTGTARSLRQIETRQIQIRTNDDMIFDANIGFIHVPENRANPRSRLIKVAFMQVLSPASTKSPTVFQFHGGPDDAAHLSHKVPIEVMENLGSGDPVIVDFTLRSRGYRDYLDFADVVIMDDRGMGHSQPRLTCTENPTPLDFMRPEDEQRHVMLSYV
ncbi:MAG: hypothetical protein AAF986_09285, partial [Pseudomonadota bacterium]